MAVTGQDVADFLGRGDDTALVALAEEVAPVVTAMARAYTRGRGFTRTRIADDIGAVITVAAGRMASNPGQIDTTVGPFSIRGGFAGWTLAELAVLNRYRTRAM